MGATLSRIEAASRLFYFVLFPLVTVCTRIGHRIRTFLVQTGILHTPWENVQRNRNRRRALTDPPQPYPPTIYSSVLKRDTPQLTSSQLQSLFLTFLVLDVRLIIYADVLENRSFHLSSGTTLAPPSKFICIRPSQPMDMVHGECHGRQGSSHLLSLPLTCRWM